MTSEAREKLQDLVGDFRDGMLITREADGRLLGRPMHIAEHDEAQGTLTFVTSLHTDKVAEIKAQPSTGVTLQSGSVFVSLSGTADISQDRQRMRSLWSTPMDVWFPDGPEQEDACLIVFQAATGEYWDQSGTQGLHFLWKAATALARDEKIDMDGGVDSHAETTV